MIRCREIGIDDLDAVADLLTRGFVCRSGGYWIRAPAPVSVVLIRHSTACANQLMLQCEQR